MPDFDEAIALLEAAVSPLGTETLPLEEAGGRYLAGRLTARSDAPRRACSVMDGYAVVESGTQAGDWLDCIGEVRAGQLPERALEPGQTMRIFTGAFLPEGADRVIMQEYAERDGDRVRFREGFGPARHVREAGSSMSEETKNKIVDTIHCLNLLLDVPRPWTFIVHDPTGSSEIKPSQGVVVKRTDTMDALPEEDEDDDME